ncbi:hypothetical protein F2P81_025428 [Scophthalmus maximus]|uniref:Uncharacterized protein n=1 Tax=Scophthalmus maximus TaxID=52904 RepID=A0A6A4RTK0_SCOMX|nr:hypothetical protein F2P81_025428 [Scophthalmus maximus]
MSLNTNSRKKSGCDVTVVDRKSRTDPSATVQFIFDRTASVLSPSGAAAPLGGNPWSKLSRDVAGPGSWLEGSAGNVPQQTALTGPREPTVTSTGHRRQDTGHRRQDTGHRRQDTGHRTRPTDTDRLNEPLQLAPG